MTHAALMEQLKKGIEGIERKLAIKPPVVQPLLTLPEAIRQLENPLDIDKTEADLMQAVRDAWKEFIHAKSKYEETCLLKQGTWERMCEADVAHGNAINKLSEFLKS